MKDIRRSRRLRIPRRRHQRTKPIFSDEEDESDLEYERFRQKTIAQTNKNANRTATSLFDTITSLPIEEKPPLLPLTSEHSSLFLYSINSRQKPMTRSDDLTPLSTTASNTTPLTALTCSNTKQTELGTVKIDLTDLSGTDTLDSSITQSDHEQSISFNRKFSTLNIDYQISDKQNSIVSYDTDTSTTSKVFSKENLFVQEHVSYLSSPSVGNGDCTIISTSSLNNETSLPPSKAKHINLYQPLSFNWTLPHITDKMKLFIGCFSLILIAGIALLMIIL